MEITQGQYRLKELFSTSSLEDIKENTEANLIISDNLKIVDV